MRVIERDIVGAFIFSTDKKLLLGKSYDGGVYKDAWIIPGGGVNPGETKLEALKREVLEETGIDLGDAKINEMNIELNGESNKTLRDTGETVHVLMTFFNFIVHLNT